MKKNHLWQKFPLSLVLSLVCFFSVRYLLIVATAPKRLMKVKTTFKEYLVLSIMSMGNWSVKLIKAKPAPSKSENAAEWIFGHSQYSSVTTFVIFHIPCQRRILLSLINLLMRPSMTFLQMLEVFFDFKKVAQKKGFFGSSRAIPI